MKYQNCFFARIVKKIANKLKILIGSGMTTEFNFSYAEKKIYGMSYFLRKYRVHDGYLLIFKYLSDSAFELSVYDTQCMNHFRDCYGNYRFDDFMFPSEDDEVIEISDSSNSLSKGDVFKYYNNYYIIKILFQVNHERYNVLHELFFGIGVHSDIEIISLSESLISTSDSSEGM